MSDCLHPASDHHFELNFQNGGHQQYEGNVTSKEKFIQNGGHQQDEGNLTGKEKFNSKWWSLAG